MTFTLEPRRLDLAFRRVRLANRTRVARLPEPRLHTVPIGSLAEVGGPRGSKVLVGRPDAWYLAGDETAVPAIRRSAEMVDAAATGRILVEVAAPRTIPRMPAANSASTSETAA